LCVDKRQPVARATLTQSCTAAECLVAEQERVHPFSNAEQILSGRVPTVRGRSVPRVLGFAVAKALFLACCFLPAGGHCQRVLVVTTEQNAAPPFGSYCQGTYAFTDLTAAGLPFDVRTYGRFMTMDMTPYDLIILNGHTSPVPVAQVSQRCQDLMAAGKKIFINGYLPFRSYDVTGTILTELYYADALFGAQPGGQFWVTGLPTLPASLQKDPMITAAGVSDRYIQTFSLPSPAPVEIRLAGKLVGFVGPTGGALRGYSEYEFNLLDYGKLVNYIRHGDATIVGFANDRVDGSPIVAFHTDCHAPSRETAINGLSDLTTKYGVKLTNTLTYAGLTAGGAAKWNSITNPLMAVGSHSRTHPNDWTAVTNLWSETGQAIADTRTMIPRTLNFLTFTGSKNPTVAQLDQLVQWGVLFDGQGLGGRRCPWPDSTYHEYQVMPINGSWLKNLALSQYTPTWPSETLSADNEVYSSDREYDKVMAEQYARNCKYGLYSYGYFHDTIADPIICYGYVQGVPMSTCIDRAMKWFHDQGVHFMFPHDLVPRLQDYVAGNITYVANPDASITITATRPGSLVNEIKVGFKGDLTPVADPGPSVVSQTLGGDCVYIKLPAETTSTVQVRWESRLPVAPVVKYPGTHISTASVIPWEEPLHPWGIAEYQYAVGTTPGAVDAQNWVSAGTSTSGILTQASLQDGVTYYVSVRSRYASSGWSDSGVSGPLTADMTPPATPVVADDGLKQEATSYLHGVWSSNDPESGVVECCYAIGTQPGDNSVLNWTFTTQTDITAEYLTLQVGQKYYFSVKAKNGVGLWSAIGASDGITIALPVPITIGLSRRQPDGTHVIFSGVVVTALFDSEFYVESTDKSSGIKVISDYAAELGEALDIDGYIYRDDVERTISVMSIAPASPGSVEPVWMANWALGGADGPEAPGATGGLGLNNVGLLVKAIGKILGTGTNYILIDDGSRVPYIGTQKGVRVSVTSPHSYHTGQYVAVTGISHLWQDSASFRRMILTRSNSDIQELIP
jgi:hypothetical protein